MELLMLIVRYVFLGVLFMGISIPLMQRRIKPNPWYGFRTPKTLSSPEIWYPANAYSGQMMFLAGMLTVLAALVIAPLGLIGAVSAHGYNAAMLAIFLASLGYALYRSFRFLSRL
jgi:uncharacterized membrane protein